MKKFLAILTLSTLLVMIIPIKNAKAWINNDFTPHGSYYNIHNDDTIKWCMDRGMNKSYAEGTGKACAAVDVIFASDRGWHLDRHKSIGTSIDTRVIHSNEQMIIAKKLIDLASTYMEAYGESKSQFEKLRLRTLIKRVKDEAIIYLGRSLHPIQDIYAHLDAGVNASDKEVKFSHGMLGAKEVEVKAFNAEGSYEIKKMKLERRDSKGKLYSIYDDLNYDFIDNTWVFKGGMNKENNSRWTKTRAVSYFLIDEFITYSRVHGVSFE